MRKREKTKNKIKGLKLDPDHRDISICNHEDEASPLDPLDLSTWIKTKSRALAENLVSRVPSNVGSRMRSHRAQQTDEMGIVVESKYSQIILVTGETAWSQSGVLGASIIRACTWLSLPAQGTLENVGDDRELAGSHLGQSHVVEGLTTWKGHLLEDVSPVQARLLALLVDLGLDIGQRKAHGAVSLLADDGDVPLWTSMVSEKVTPREGIPH